MRRLLTGLLLAVVLVGTAAAAQPARVLAVEWEAGGGKLRWVSPTTLRPVGSAVLNVGGGPADVVAVSPDRTLVAVGGGVEGRLRFVRLGPLRQEGLLWLRGRSVLKGIWSSPRRLVVLLGNAPPEVVVVDPSTRKVVRRQQLSGVTMGAVRAGDRLLTLLTPRDRIGPVRLAVIAGDGSVQTLAVPGITGGAAQPAEPGGTARFASPGLVAEGSRAVVLGPDRLVEIDLATLGVRGQQLDTRTTSRAAKRVEGWGRGAVWLRGDTVAYSGWSSEADGKQATTGVRVVDIKTGATRLLDAAATSVTRAGTTFLLHGGGPLRGFALDGTPRFELLAGADTGYVQVAGRYAYVGSGNSTQFAVVDVLAGSVVGSVRTDKPTTIFAP
jgi:hypothetical protein